MGKPVRVSISAISGNVGKSVHSRTMACGTVGLAERRLDLSTDIVKRRARDRREVRRAEAATAAGSDREAVSRKERTFMSIHCVRIGRHHDEPLDLQGIERCDNGRRGRDVRACRAVRSKRRAGSSPDRPSTPPYRHRRQRPGATGSTIEKAASRSASRAARPRADCKLVWIAMRWGVERDVIWHRTTPLAFVDRVGGGHDEADARAGAVCACMSHAMVPV